MKKTYLENPTTAIFHEEHRFREVPGMPRKNRFEKLRKAYLFQDRVDRDTPFFSNDTVPSFYGRRKASIYMRENHISK